MAEEDGRSPSSKSAWPIAVMASRRDDDPESKSKGSSTLQLKNIVQYQRCRRHVGHNHFPFGFALSPTH